MRWQVRWHECCAQGIVHGLGGNLQRSEAIANYLWYNAPASLSDDSTQL